MSYNNNNIHYVTIPITKIFLSWGRSGAKEMYIFSYELYVSVNMLSRHCFARGEKLFLLSYLSFLIEKRQENAFYISIIFVSHLLRGDYSNKKSKFQSVRMRAIQ